MGGLQYSPARIFARPAAESVWLGPAQQSVRSHLLAGPPVRLVVGPPSSGKSTLLAHAGAALGAGATVLTARGPHATAAGLLIALLQSAELSAWELSCTELRNLLAVFIQQRRIQRRRVVVAVDDAHTLADEAWNELERLRTWQIDRAPAVELLLVGETPLAEQRAAVWFGDHAGGAVLQELPAASATDLASYIDWRLAQFDLDGLITPDAAQLIAQLAGGRFAIVDLLCQMSLLLLRRHGLERVDRRVVRQARTAFAADREAKVAASETLGAATHADSAPAPRGHLVVSRDGKMLKRVPLAERLLIGRSQHNDLCLSSPYLGRHHAAVLDTPEGYYVVDLNSLNGVELNGERTARAILSDGDVITLGPFRLKVQLPQWIPQGEVLSDAASLADTAIIPNRVEPPVALKRIK